MAEQNATAPAKKEGKIYGGTITFIKATGGTLVFGNNALKSIYIPKFLIEVSGVEVPADDRAGDYVVDVELTLRKK